MKRHTRLMVFHNSGAGGRRLRQGIQWFPRGRNKIAGGAPSTPLQGVEGRYERNQCWSRHRCRMMVLCAHQASNGLFDGWSMVIR